MGRYNMADANKGTFSHQSGRFCASRGPSEQSAGQFRSEWALQREQHKDNTTPHTINILPCNISPVTIALRKKAHQSAYSTAS